MSQQTKQRGPKLVKSNMGPNQKKKEKKKAKRKNKVSVVSRDAATRPERFFLSACSRHYLRALADPFMLEGGLACIPDIIDYPSAKYAIKARGTFSAGTEGFGFIVVAPLASASDAVAIVSSLPSFTGTTVSCGPTTLVGISNAFAAFPYDSANIPHLWQRTVGCGLRVRYLGTELNRSGRLLGIRVPSGSFIQGLDASSALANMSVQSVEVGRKWRQVFFVPSSQSDYQYSIASIGINQTTIVGANGTIAFIVDGTTASNAFEWEVVYHKEYANNDMTTLAITNLTPSHSDLTGLSAVRNYFEGAISYMGGTELYNQALSYLSNWSPQDVSHVVAAGSSLYRAASMITGRDRSYNSNA